MLINLGFFSSQALIAEKEGYPVDEQIVLLGGKPLDSGLLVNLCEDQSTLDVNIRLLGGMTFFCIKLVFKIYLICDECEMWTTCILLIKMTVK